MADRNIDISVTVSDRTRAGMQRLLSRVGSIGRRSAVDLAAFEERARIRATDRVTNYVLRTEGRVTAARKAQIDELVRHEIAQRRAAAMRLQATRGLGGAGLDAGALGFGGIAGGAAAAAKRLIPLAAGMFSVAAAGRAVSSGVRAGTGALLGMVAAASESDQALNVLAATLKNTGQFTQGNMEMLESMARRLSGRTVFNVFEVIDAMNQLLAMGVQFSQLERAIKGALDFAAFSRGRRTVVDSAVGIGKAVAGQTEILREAGIQLDAATAKAEGFTGVMEALEKVVGGQAVAATEDFAGRARNAGDAIKLLSAAAGTYITRNREVNVTVSATTTVLQRMAEDMSKAKDRADRLSGAFNSIMPLMEGAALSAAAFADRVVAIGTIAVRATGWLSKMGAEFKSLKRSALEAFGGPVGNLLSQVLGVGEGGFLSAAAGIPEQDTILFNTKKLLNDIKKERENAGREFDEARLRDSLAEDVGEQARTRMMRDALLDRLETLRKLRAKGAIEADAFSAKREKALTTFNKQLRQQMESDVAMGLPPRLPALEDAGRFIPPSDLSAIQELTTSIAAEGQKRLDDAKRLEENKDKLAKEAAAREAKRLEEQRRNNETLLRDTAKLQERLVRDELDRYKVSEAAGIKDAARRVKLRRDVANELFLLQKGEAERTSATAQIAAVATSEAQRDLLATMRADQKEFFIFIDQLAQRHAANDRKRIAQRAAREKRMVELDADFAKQVIEFRLQTIRFTEDMDFDSIERTHQERLSAAKAAFDHDVDRIRAMGLHRDEEARLIRERNFDLHRDNVAFLEEFQSAFDGASERRMEAWRKEAEEIANRAKESGQAWERFFFDVLDGRMKKFGDLGKMILDNLKRQVASALAQRVAGGALGAAGGFLVSALGFPGIPIPAGAGGTFGTAPAAAGSAAAAAAAAAVAPRAVNLAPQMRHSGTLRVESAGNPAQVLDIDTVRAIAANTVNTTLQTQVSTGTGPVGTAFKQQRRQ